MKSELSVLPDFSLGETQIIELKEALPKESKIAQIATGFANTHGGQILFGITNEGHFLGIKGDLDKAQISISSALQTISPVPRYDIQIISGTDQNQMIAVTIEKAIDRTFHTHEGVIYVRSGSTTRRMDGQAQLDFLRHRQLLSFDESIAHKASLSDLDVEKIKTYLGLRGQPHYLEEHTLEEFFINQNLATHTTSTLNLISAAILLFGKNPTQFYPQIELKVVRFEEEDAVKIVSHELIQADLPQAIERAFAFVKTQLPKSITIHAIKREEHFGYPLNVIREAIVNAVAHRDYDSRDSIQISLFSDRIDIVSPGGLPKGLTPTMFGQLSVQRNATIYRILRDMNYIEGLGTGIPRMKNEMRKAHLQDPQFTYDDYFFRVTIYNGVKRPVLVSVPRSPEQRHKKMLDYLSQHPLIKTTDYMALTGVSRPTAVADIQVLLERGLILRTGTRRGTYYTQALRTTST